MNYGSIEAGGTKFVVAVGDENQNILNKATFPTEAPAETMPHVIEFFKENPVVALGIGSFGPIEMNPEASDYGFITETPKLAWRNFDFLGALQQEFDIPMYWTTDVNVAAWGEYKQGAAKDAKHLFYSTIGTGIGGSFIANDQFFAGMSHPETGHIPVERYPEDDFAGVCPSHGNCLEGMASGPAIEARIGHSAKDLPIDDKHWQMEAFYIAQACVTYTLLYSPEIIVLGGGVSNQAALFPMIREAFAKKLNNYVSVPPLDQYIQHAAFGDGAGTVGALLLAKKAFEEA